MVTLNRNISHSSIQSRHAQEQGGAPKSTRSRIQSPNRTKEPKKKGVLQRAQEVANTIGMGGLFGGDTDAIKAFSGDLQEKARGRQEAKTPITDSHSPWDPELPHEPAPIPPSTVASFHTDTSPPQQTPSSTSSPAETPDIQTLTTHLQTFYNMMKAKAGALKETLLPTHAEAKEAHQKSKDGTSLFTKFGTLMDSLQTHNTEKNREKVASFLMGALTSFLTAKVAVAGYKKLKTGKNGFGKILNTCQKALRACAKQGKNLLGGIIDSDQLSFLKNLIPNLSPQNALKTETEKAQNQLATTAQSAQQQIAQIGNTPANVEGVGTDTMNMTKQGGGWRDTLMSGINNIGSCFGMQPIGMVGGGASF